MEEEKRELYQNRSPRITFLTPLYTLDTFLVGFILYSIELYVNGVYNNISQLYTLGFLTFLSMVSLWANCGQVWSTIGNKRIK
jgi:hypothetical protein